jgi:GNAT superfamily N-acetyltransferase
MTDMAAMHGLLVDAESVDHTGEHFDVDDLTEEFADPALDLALDTLGAFDGPDLLAYAAVLSLPATDVHRVVLGGVVHPKWRGRGLGGRLLDWQVRRGAEAHAELHPDVPGELLTQIHEPNQAKRAAYEAHGFTMARWFVTMNADLTGDLPPVGDVPDGLALLPFTPAYDGRVHAAHREAFADHWGSSPPDAAAWRQRFTGSRLFRPDISFVMVEGDEVAGYLLGYESDADTAAKGFRAGWVGQLGTRRAWRRRGVGGALLRHFLLTARDAGCRQATLTVDSDSPTGAVALYERHRFVADDAWIRYVRTV